MTFSSKSTLGVVAGCARMNLIELALTIAKYKYRYSVGWLWFLNSCYCCWSNLAAAGRKHFTIWPAILSFYLSLLGDVMKYRRLWNVMKRLDLCEPKLRVAHAQRSLWNEFGSGKRGTWGVETRWLMVGNKCDWLYDEVHLLFPSHSPNTPSHFHIKSPPIHWP